ncbi:myelin protein zero-like protein 3 [Nothobranchius furzeri]|uniref:Myelin protein zero-like 3 n=1 Tax=Nothobranchius furzeri TaxID=105023 RepID=A0A1A8B354_NOTFU
MSGLVSAGAWRQVLVLVAFIASFPVLSIKVTTRAALHASKGDTVSLSCTFASTSTPTSKMTVDWSYKPQTGGPTHTFFHFSSQVFPPKDPQFAGRVRWQGRPAHGDVSISLINATLNDNGTYTCSVRNPPDVHGSTNSHIVLTVTPKVRGIHFTDVAVLLAFVLLPSGVITLLLIGRILCPRKERSQSKAYRSPIELIEREEYVVHPQAARAKGATCCDLYLMDSGDEYYSLKKRPPKDEDYMESGL